MDYIILVPHYIYKLAALSFYGQMICCFNLVSKFYYSMPS